MTERNGLDAESSQGREMDTVNSSHEQGIQGYFGPSIRQAVSQYQGLLREGLEREVQRIIYEVESATVDIESTIAKRIKSRLKGLVQDEVRRIFDDALSNAENSLIEPPLGREWKMRSDSIGQRRQSNVVKDEESVPHDSGAENDDHSDWSEGSHVETPPQPVDPSPTTGEREAGGDYEIAEPPLPPGQPLTAREPVNYQNLETEPGNQESSVPSDEASSFENESEYQQWDPAELEEDPPNEDDDEVEAVDDVEDVEDIFEGTVRLNIEANDCIRQVVSFVRELRQKPQFRLLRLVGNNREGVDIWLSLREPLHLKKMLPQIEGVSLVTTQKAASPENERLLMVRLTKNPKPQEDTSWTDNRALTEATEALA